MATAFTPPGASPDSVARDAAGAAQTTAGIAAAGALAALNAAATAQSGADLSAKKASNLSDLANAGTARTNLGLGTAAVANTGTTVGTVPVLDGDGKVPAAMLPAASSGLVQRDWSGGSAITTASAAGAGGVVTGDVADFFDLGVIHRLRVVANSNTVLATVQLYADAARTTLLRELAGIDAFTAAYEMALPVHYRDADNTASLHYRIVNAGLNASTFTLTVQGIGE